MSTTLEHTTTEHPTTEQAPPPPDRWKRGVGVAALVLGLGTIIAIDLIQQGPAEVPQETFSPETHRDGTPPRTDPDVVVGGQSRQGGGRQRSPEDVFSPEAHRIPSSTATGSREAAVGSATGTPTDLQLGVEPTGSNNGHHPGLYAADELATLRLVRAGQLPRELLETELFITKRLVNEGRIPAASVR